jgi:molecular chaperone DnaK
MGAAIGIDLGTTNSVACYKKNDIRILQNKESEDSTRSIVGWYKGRKGEGQLLVGKLAFDKMIAAPKDTIVSIKRLMGRSFSDPEVQKIKKNFFYDVVSPSEGTDEALKVIMNGKQYSPVQISSLIIKKIREDSEARLSDSLVDQAVITVPAYFTDKQRDATRLAGRLAGLKVQKILPEPTAAAIAYGVDNVKEDDAKTVLVYDMGGGTFDVSILSIAGGVFAELGIEGDMWLGGDDFDTKIADYVIDQIKEEYDIDIDKLEEKKKLRFKLELKKESEKAKKALSSTTSTDISIIGLLEDEERNLIDVMVDITRDQFEQMIQKKVKKSISIVKAALNNTRLTPEQIDNVILVGGSTMIPMVQKALKDIFGKDKILTNVDPLKCVAQGAAILAARLGGTIECIDCKTPNPAENEKCINCGSPLTDIIFGVTGCDYGIITVGDKFETVIPKGSNYPSLEAKIELFFTPFDNMRRIRVPVQAKMGDGSFEQQATVWLSLPENVKKETPVDVAFSMDENGVLNKVKVILKDGSGRETEVMPDRGRTERSRVEKELEQAKQIWNKNQDQADSLEKDKINRLYNEAIDALEADDISTAEKKSKMFEEEVGKIGVSMDDLPEWKQRAQGNLNYAAAVIDDYSSLVNPEKIYKLKKLMEELKTAYEKDDRTLGEQKREELVNALDEIPVTVQNLMYIENAMYIARKNSNFVTADKLNGMWRELFNAYKNNDNGTINRVLEDIKPVLDEAFKDTVVSKTDRELADDRLTRQKASSSGIKAI